VIEASRAFICIRPATFENAAEAKYLEKIFKGRAGTLENTVFAMLSPDATKYLARPSRSPQMNFGTPENMAAAMKEIAAKFVARGTPSGVPAMQDFRLSLNTAACDSMPLVVAVGGGGDVLEKLAWSAELLGKYAYAPVSTVKELKSASIVVARPGIYAIEPDTYGQKGALLGAWPLTATQSELTRGLLDAQKKHNGKGKLAGQHIQQGNQLGITWKSLVPNTDPHGPPR
jgi:hypothetical protein